MIHKIRAMYDEGRGSSMRQIAQELGLSRNTVRKYLRGGVEEIEALQRQSAREKGLDAHREYLVHLLEQYPRLSAVKVKRKLEAQAGPVAMSTRSFRRYVSSLRDEVCQAQPRYYEPVLDEVPGVQCQVDAGELRGVIVDGIETVVHFLVFVLSYSRLMYVSVSRRAFNTSSFIQAHDEAFRAFGGCPSECVYDQTKLVVIAEQYRELTLNEQFAHYASASGFRVRVCEGYDPESKGKVEAGVKYVQNDGLYGETFASWSALTSHIGEWLEVVANERVHGTTGEVPRARFERDERAVLNAYLTPDCVTSLGEWGELRRVDKTGLISYRGNKYSVPMVFQRGQVRVVATGSGQLEIHHAGSGEKVASHELSTGKGELVRNGNHYRDKSERRTVLETHIIKTLGESTGTKLCEQLYIYEPTHYLDKLRGLKRQLPRVQQFPQTLLEPLLERPGGLAMRTLVEYLDAFDANPERVLALQSAPSASAGPHTPASDALRAYATIAPASKELH